MKIVFAPDSFKGSLSALDIVKLLEIAAANVFPSVETVGVPIADGGEGTIEALLAAVGGKKRIVEVTGPLGRRVNGAYGILSGNKIAVIEMAQASGLPLIDRAELDPLRATSRGTGEILRSALDYGVEEILIGIGGSATNDGGTGLLRELGVRFLDEHGTEVEEGGGYLCDIHRVDLSSLDPRLNRTRIRVICDVTNPLLGANGATYIYGPQKGVTADLCPVLDRGMENYADVLERALGRSYRELPGAGAAGGMGFALVGVLGAQLLRGVDVILDIVQFEKLITDADLVITAEGRMDKQSVDFGKVPIGVAERCHKHGVPVLAIVGGMTQDAMTFCGESASLTTTVNGIMSIEYAMENAAELFSGAAERMFRMIKIGNNMKGNKPCL